MEELSHEVRQYRVGVSTGVEHAQTPHEVGNWTIETEASNAFNSVLQERMLEQVTDCTPARVRRQVLWRETRLSILPDGLGRTY